MKLMERWKQSHLHTLFNLEDDLAKGRVSLLLHSALGSMISWLTSGLFYTSFLMSNGIDLVNINIITYVPLIASCFAIFAPSILERIPRRKWLLAGVRLMNFTLNLLGITLLPVFVSDPQLKVICFVALVFLSALIENLVCGGYSVWHLRFMPENIRADFISVQNIFTNFLGIGTALLSGLVADAMSGSPYEDTIIVAFRYIAYGLGIVNVLVLLWPKEYPYERSGVKIRLRNVFLLPLRQHKFLLTIMILFMWSFFGSIPGSTLSYYLLNNVGIKYSFMNIIDMFYPLFLILFMPFWKKQLRTRGWWKTYIIAGMLQAPTTIMYSCVTAANYLWLMPTLRFMQHFLGVGFSLASGNIVYLNLPETDQTNYLTFYSLCANCASFLGVTVGTWFVATFPDIRIALFGMEFITAQVLQWVYAFGQFAAPMLALCLLKKLNPDDPRRQFA